MAAVQALKDFGAMFYIVNPYESMFKNIEDIPDPDWTSRAFPYFLGLIFVEHLVLRMKGKRGIRINDGITSLSLGMMMLMKDILLHGVLNSAYIYIYEKHRLYELPWDSVWTWVAAAIGGDFAYYWVHRAAHEVNLLWAGHQVHHSSEDYNLTTALRQSIAQAFGSWPFYLPMALFIPPTHVLVHYQFNLLYQFWIHTEAVSTIGPLEHVLNTPQHHRVHHGSNRYCLDKNYAGVLIIWDRMFGTFEWERKDEKIVYGLVDQPQFFNPAKHQLFYYEKIWEKARSMTTWSDWLSAFIKGPGWFPGTERLGDPSGVPEIPNRKVYHPRVSTWENVYAVVHFLLAFLAFEELNAFNVRMSESNVLLVCTCLVWTLTSIGLIFDRSSLAWPSEAVRSGLALFVFGTMAISAGNVGNFRRIPTRALMATFGASLVVAVGKTVASAMAPADKKKTKKSD